MKIIVSQSTLIKHLELVVKITTKHVTLPVLQCVMFVVKDGSLNLRATNLEIAIESVCKDVEIESEGSIAVPAQTLLQVVQSLNAKKITLEVTENSLSVTSDKTSTTINTIPHEEFPTIPQIKTEALKINNKLFTLGIKTAAFAASQSSIKPELGSVYIHQKKEHSLTFVATDSFRLVEKTVPQKGVILNDSLLIPQKNALEIARICELVNSDFELMITENQCAFLFEDGIYVTTRLVSGTFPDYESIIPKEFSTHSTILKQDLILAFKKTNIFLNKFRQVKLIVDKQTIEVSSQNGEVGTVSDTIPAQTEGDELTLSFNQQYVSDPLQYINDDSIILHFAGIGRPLVINGVSDNSIRYLVMPMNK